MAGLLFGTTQYLQFVQGHSRWKRESVPPRGAGPDGRRHRQRNAGAPLRNHQGRHRGHVLLAATMPVVLLWEVDTPYWAVGAAIAVIGFAAANIFAPATEAVMGAVPEEKAGVGSGDKRSNPADSHALGIAVIGSAMNSIYTSRVAAAVTRTTRRSGRSGQRLGGSCPPDSRLVPGDAGAALSTAAAEAFTDALASRSSSAPPSSSSEPSWWPR